VRPYCWPNSQRWLRTPVGTGLCEDYLAFADRLDTYDVWITLGLMASATERVTLASIVTPLAWRQPWTVAAQATTVDHISGGRFVLGVGIGDNAAAEGSRFRAPMSDRQRASRVDEALDVIAALWSGEPVSRNGEFHLEQAELLPRPVARPRIPIWIGGALTRPGPRARALRWDGACLYRIPGGWEDVTAGDVRQLRSDALNRAETPNPSLSSWVDAVAKTTSPPKSATSEPSPRLEPTGGTSTSHPASASKRPVSAYSVDR
jgi:alkanesulfonate monooxygenase SsuD/methylene tetrahydromethanopterin reductase-like flavin-dependent oxidoreductase (luciferase family)